jgi:hypothetical protein
MNVLDVRKRAEKVKGKVLPYAHVSSYATTGILMRNLMTNIEPETVSERHNKTRVNPVCR